MPPVNYNYKSGVDIPTWQWMSFFPVTAQPGGACAYDGSRYVYWAMQVGVATATASTTQLWRFDTRTNAWQFLSVLTSGNAGIDIEYDAVRNVVYVIHGVALTSWQVFNLNTTSVSISGVTCPAWAATTVTPVLPAAANAGASLTQPGDSGLAATIDSGVAEATGNTATVVKATDATGTFGAGMIGLQIRVTSGAQNNAVRTISAVADKNTLTIGSALSGALAGGDTFVIEPVQVTLSAGSTTTATGPVAGTAWIVNQYTDHDIVVVSGTGAGQRKRIASNTATVLTLAAAVTGNPNTGPFATALNNTSVIRIVPSADFLYYHPGNGSTALYRIDVNTGATATTWSASLATAPAAIGPGSNTFWAGAYAPGYIIAFRGAATAGVLLFNIATKAWTTLTTFPGGETFTTGANSCMLHGKRKLFVQKEGTTRTYLIDLLTGMLEPGPTIPYAAPGAIDGKRAKFVKTPDGVEWLYFQRGSGQELYRVALEWL